MQRVLLCMCAFFLTLPAVSALAQGGGDGKDGGSEPLRRSEFSRGSYPGGPGAKAPLSTGYYVADNDGPQIGGPWAPSYDRLDTTTIPLRRWRRIVSGPTQRVQSFWTQPGSYGYEYFRNPNNPTDSTDNAIAGPISIGFPFYYYGRKYDSFYVSTNGIIGLTNRRYQYDEQGNRVAYEPVFDDTRPVTADPLTDPARDDYGYTVIATGGTPGVAGTSPTGGLMNPNNSPFPQPAQKSVIAPLWDDTELSQYDPEAIRPDDFGKVYWAVDETGTKLMINFVNQSMKGAKNIPIIGGTATMQPRELRATYTVVLDRLDSSIQIHYIAFRGVWTEPQSLVISVPSQVMYRSNATIGVQSHDGEFTNYLSNADFGGAVYVNGSPTGTPHDALAIKFKQWKNVVRVLNVTFQVPSLFSPGTYKELPLDQTAENFELLLGHPLLGVIRPVGVVQNVTSDVGPVNITPQPVRFNVTFRIRDLVNVGGALPYQRTAITKSLYPIFGSSNVRPSVDTIVFDPYITNPNIPRQAGRFRAEVIAVDQAPNGSSYGQQWPFDDTTGVRLFGIKRLEAPFITSFNDYDVSQEEGAIPSVHQWVSIGPEIVDGESNTYNPPPPRGRAGIRELNTPVCLLDRKDNSGSFYANNAAGVLCGDTLISFPINVSQMVANPVLLLSYQRSGKQQNGYPRGFSDNQRIGPEHAVYNTVKDQRIQTPDKLVVEFAEPSSNGVDNIVNISGGNWRLATFNKNTDKINWGISSPRWGIFGGGGGSQSATGVSDTNGKVIVDEFDAGKDFEFNRAYIPIPARWSKVGPGNKTFRFRIRSEVKMDGNPFGSPADDGDNFYVDNVMLVEPDKPEVEITAVRVDWPYTEAPASQARAIPLSVKIGNNGSAAATTFGVAMYVENRTSPPPPGFWSYYRYQSVISVPAGGTRVENFPTWNAQECGSQFRITPNAQPSTTTDYRIHAQILPPNFDSYSDNDKNYIDFKLKLGTTFAYDDGGNDVQNFAQLVGKGLNLVPPTNQDGTGASPYGPSGGSSSGSFAMQIRILTRDTIRGFQAYFGGANQAQDFISYSIYKQPPGSNINNPPSGQPVVTINARRGEGIPSGLPPYRDFNFDQFVTYMLDTPYVAEPGIYFITVAQLGQTGLELGGDASRMGQVTTIMSPGPPVGVGNYSIAAHPEMRQNRFWYEVTTHSGGWNPMITLTNNPGYPHLDYQGSIGLFKTYTRGSWIPMIRPYFGLKESNACLVEPVELASFEVTELADALRLDWQTASEKDNHGFYVERRQKNAEEAWSDIAFKVGAGTSNQVHAYDHVDHAVAPNVTYQYRLRQEDRDGSVHYSGIKEGRINSAVSGESTVLGQNVPNPMSSSTRIAFRVAESGKVMIEINDVYGKSVRSIEVDAKAGESSEVVWDGRDASGIEVPSGTYMYKLVGEGFTLSRKLTVTR